MNKKLGRNLAKSGMTLRFWRIYANVKICLLTNIEKWE